MNSGSRKWIKLWVDPWLSSTMRFTLDHRHRAVWADLLALGGQSRISGVICSGEESGEIVGLPLLRLAGLVDVPTEELSTMLELFEKQDRIKVEHDSGGRIIIRLLNWSKYQAEYSKQARYKAKKKQQKESSYPHGYQKATSEVTGGGYQKATSLEVEVEVEELQNHSANPPGSHGGVALPSDQIQGSADEKLTAIQRTWDYYIVRLEKNHKLLTFSPIRRQKGLARLAECLQKTGGDLAKAEGLMRVAVDALAASDFHIGKNDRGRRYDSWEENLFRNREQLERWLEQS